MLDRIHLLQETSMFGGVTDEALQLLIGRAREVRVARYELFFREGESGTSAFVLEDGEVSILKRTGDGDVPLGTLRAGDCFGEVALLDFGARSASVLAETDCRAIELRARDLFEVSKEHPRQFATIYMNLGRELSRRLRAADERLLQARLDGSAYSIDYPFRTS